MCQLHLKKWPSVKHRLEKSEYLSKKIRHFIYILLCLQMPPHIRGRPGAILHHSGTYHTPVHMTVTVSSQLFTQGPEEEWLQVIKQAMLNFHSNIFRPQFKSMMKETKAWNSQWDWIYKLSWTEFNNHT